MLRIDRVAMASGNDRPYYSGKHKAHGVNVQVIADPVGRLIWASPALPGARHDAGAAAHHDIPAALAAAEVTAYADTAYRGAGLTIRNPGLPRRAQEIDLHHERDRGPQRPLPPGRPTTWALPTEQAAPKILYLTVRERRPNRVIPTGQFPGWKAILNGLAMTYGDRLNIN